MLGFLLLVTCDVVLTIARLARNFLTKVNKVIPLNESRFTDVSPLRLIGEKADEDFAFLHFTPFKAVQCFHLTLLKDLKFENCFLTRDSFVFFQSIEPGETFTSDASTQVYNKSKNRYPYIFACEYNITLIFQPCLVPVRLSPRPSRSIEFSDVTDHTRGRMSRKRSITAEILRPRN